MSCSASSLGPVERPDAVVECSLKERYIGVELYVTGSTQPDVRYFFSGRDTVEDQLFLFQAVYVRERDEHATPVATVSFHFDVAGEVRIVEGGAERTVAVDVTANFEPVPAFGDWSSIARAERDLRA